MEQNRCYRRFPEEKSAREEVEQSAGLWTRERTERSELLAVRERVSGARANGAERTAGSERSERACEPSGVSETAVRGASEPSESERSGANEAERTSKQLLD